MPKALATTNEAIDRVVNMFRDRLESAFRHGQRVRMDAREGTSSVKVPTRVFTNAPLTDLLAACEPDGSFELHVYIEPKPGRRR